MFQVSWGSCAGRSSKRSYKETRIVPVCGKTEVPYRNNHASTTKYTLLSYLPKALFEQYRRVANIFFTLMAALSLTPWSPVRPWTTWTPLALVMGVSMIKEAREDYKRHCQDKEVNERPTRVLDPETGDFVTVPWRSVAVGDVVRVLRDEFLPADLILLASSNAEGTCFVETVNLDGETNLKTKAAPEETKALGLGSSLVGGGGDGDGMGRSGAQLAALSAQVECESPNSRLYQFMGNLRVFPPLPPAVVAAVAARGGVAAASGGGAGGGKRKGAPVAEAATSAVRQEAGLGTATGLALAASAAPKSGESQGSGGDGVINDCMYGSEASDDGDGRESGGGKGSGGAGGVFVVPLSASSLLLRGCSLRNTECVYGLVVYAGHDTKIFMNSTNPPSKRSHVERIVDRVIGFIFLLLFAWCLTSAVFAARWTSDQYARHWYMRPDSPSADVDPESMVLTGVISFFISLLLYSYLVPISLYVSIEMVKVFQAMVLIAGDRDMYDKGSDMPAQARTSNLNEELGMVNTILSDKTGTLTRNVMEFFKCSVAGVPYGAGITEIEATNMMRKGTVLDETVSPEALKYRERFFNFYDSRLMGTAWFSAKDPETIEMFFRLLAVCHTVIPDGPTEPDKIKYEAESPDEAALVVAAKVFGFFFFKRTNTTVTVRERTPKGELDVEYEVLNILEFNSTRKRMSVVINDKARNRLIIFTKGADTVIYERLDPSYRPNEAMKVATSRDMEDFGAAGLRTLCLSYAEVDRDWYTNEWMPEWVAAKTSLDKRDEKVAEVSEKIEKNLRLLGCTAIEDKLQEGVPECIRQLALAGIRIWVLTGDKMETAINIGFACSLLREDMYRFTISVYGVEEIEKAEERGDKKEAERLAHEAVKGTLAKIEETMKSKPQGSQFAIVIDGKALSYALSNELSTSFLLVGLRCKAVVCCRVSPLQKAQVTKLVRSHGDTTLAIGDGANDVGMIQSAHIGVGISGQEGMQAVMSADFAIAQFRYLVPLLLIHGRYSYKRITRMVLFFFYKNMLFGVTIFVFNIFNAFSGQFIYNDFYMTLFNVVFTALTPIVIGIFDKDVDKAMALKYPGLYMAGQRNDYFNFKAIALWLLSSMYQCCIIMVFVLVGCRSIFSDRAAGNPYTMWQTGVLMFTCVVVTVHFQVVQITEQWTWAHHVSIWLSMVVWWLYLLAYGAFPMFFSTDLYDLFVGIVAPSAQYWLYTLLIPVACQLPDFFLRMAKKQLAPEDHQIVGEIQKRLEKGGKPLEAEKGQDQPSILANVFNSSPQKNKGYVPQYDVRSKFYSQVDSGARTSGRLEVGIRNPVLTDLDQELMDNPYRNRRKSALPPMIPLKGSVGGSSPPAALVAPVAESTQLSAGPSNTALGSRPPSRLTPLGTPPNGVDPMHSNGSDAPALSSVPVSVPPAPLAAGNPTGPPRNRLPPISQIPGIIASPAGDKPPLTMPPDAPPQDREIMQTYASALPR